MRFNQFHCCHLALVTIAIIFFGCGNVFAAKNPLNTIVAANFDVKSNGIKTEAYSEGGNNLCSIHAGDYVVYKNYDFDSGVAGFKARIASVTSGAIEVRFDLPTGSLLGTCLFKSTGGWQNWQVVVCKVDNSQSGVRDVFLVFRGNIKSALVNVSSMVFLKSMVASTKQIPLGFSERADFADDEPQSSNSWGMPENGFAENFEDGQLKNWTASGISITANALDQNYSVASHGTNVNFAFTPNVYINKTDTNGEWRT